MKGKAVSGVLITLLFFGMLILVFDIQKVEAGGTIYIRANGSIEPSTANITSVDNVTYYFTGNNFVPVVVERNNIVVDGNGYTLQGKWADLIFEFAYGFNLTSISNVTIRNIKIIDFADGIYLKSSSNNTISGNIIMNHVVGIRLESSSDNTISGNVVRDEKHYRFPGGTGIWLTGSFDNYVSGNFLTHNDIGIVLGGGYSNTIAENNITLNGWAGLSLYSSKNTIYGNNIEYGGYYGILMNSCFDNELYANNITKNTEGTGIYMRYSGGNKFFHNNFLDNLIHVDIEAPNQTDVWDNGYPSGGNYWSDYTGVDVYRGAYQNITGSDCIGDTPFEYPYAMTELIDNYPLMIPYLPTDELRTLYYNLLNEYTELKANIDSLNSTYNELKSEQETTTQKLNNIRNLMYVFIATTAILTSTTIYFSARTRKPKAKKKQTSLQNYQAQNTT